MRDLKLEEMQLFIGRIVLENLTLSQEVAELRQAAERAEPTEGGGHDNLDNSSDAGSG